MAWIQRLNAIADWLWLEARRRAQRRKRTCTGIDLVERNGQVYVCPRQPFEMDLSPQERGGLQFCSVSVYPRAPWVLLELTGEAPEVSIPIVVHFGHQRGLDAKGKSEKEKHAKRKEARAALWRARREGKLTGHAICIDDRTPRRHIVEQLAICLAQQGVFDESTQEAMGFRSSNAVNPVVASHLVQRFIDPSHPASYPALKEKLRRDVAGPEHAPKTTSAPSGGENIDENALTGEDRKKIPPQVTRAQDDYSVRRAAEIVGLPYRTLQQRIQDGKISIRHDRWGHRRLSTAELEKLRAEERDREIKRQLARFLAERHHISVASARRRVSRALKKGKSIEQIFSEATAIRRED